MQSFTITIVVFIFLGTTSARRYSQDRAYPLRSFNDKYPQSKNRQMNLRSKLMERFLDAEERNVQVQFQYAFANELYMPDYYTKLILEGAQGYICAGSVWNASVNRSPIVRKTLFLKVIGSPSKYSYDFLYSPSDLDNLVIQFNEQGARGYRFVRTQYYKDGNVNVFVKDLSQPDEQYTYRHLSSSRNLQELQDQINQEGTEGYLYRGFVNIGVDHTQLYMKRESTTSVYQSQLVTLVNSTAGFLDVANLLGAEGYRFVVTDYLLNYFIGTDSSAPRMWEFYLFSKDTSKSSVTYAYQALDQPKATDDFVAQFNIQAAQGFQFVKTLVFGTAARTTIYVSLDNCQCEPVDDLAYISFQ